MNQKNSIVGMTRETRECKFREIWRLPNQMYKNHSFPLIQINHCCHSVIYVCRGSGAGGVAQALVDGTVFDGTIYLESASSC